ANLAHIAGMCTVNSDQSVGFGTPPFRGMYLGTFLEAAEIIGTPPNLPSGCSLQAISDTIWNLQQSDGSIPRQYSSLTHTLGGDDETTNAALLAFSAGVIAHIQQENAQRLFDLQTVPSDTPRIGI